jgi:hypothetical protein
MSEPTNPKAYQLVGINVAMHLLRPGAKWEYTGGVGFTRWDDPRPKPSIDEVFDVIEKIKAFEESINTIYLPEQKAEMEAQLASVEQAMNS